MGFLIYQILGPVNQVTVEVPIAMSYRQRHRRVTHPFRTDVKGMSFVLWGAVLTGFSGTYFVLKTCGIDIGKIGPPW